MALYSNRKNRLAIKVIPALMTAGIIGLCGIMPVGAEGLSNNTQIVTKDDSYNRFDITLSKDAGSESANNRLFVYDQTSKPQIWGINATLRYQNGETASIHDNSVTITNKESKERNQISSVYGIHLLPYFQTAAGQPENGIIDVKNNALTIENSDVFGPITGIDDTNSNTNDGSSLHAKNNSFTLNDSTVNGEFYHIILNQPNEKSENIITDNKAMIKDAKIEGAYFNFYQTYGVSNKLDMERNSSNFENSTINGNAFGNSTYGFGGAIGRTHTAQSSDNTMTFSKSTITGMVMQDFIYGDDETIKNNRLILTNGSHVENEIDGEYLYGTESVTHLEAEGNSTSLMEGSKADGGITSVMLVNLYGPKATMKASGNTLLISGKSVAPCAKGVEVVDKADSDISSTANTVSISDGSTVGVAMAVHGAGNADRNKVSVNDSTVGVVAGAAVDGEGNITNNSVTIGGNTKVDYESAHTDESFLPYSSKDAISLKGHSVVIAGYSTGNGSIDNNAVNITGQADLENADLYGYLGGKGSGNMLRIGYDGSQDAVWKNPSDNKVKSVSNFDTIELHQGTWGKAMLLVADDMDLSHTKVDISHLSFENGAPAKPNSETVLIDDEGTSYNNSNTQIYDGNEGNGISLAYSLGNSASALLSGSFIGKGTTDNGNIVLKTGNVNVNTVDFNQVEWGKTPLTLDSGVTYDFSNAKINTAGIIFNSIASLREGTNTMTLMNTHNGRVINLTNSRLSGETLPYRVGTTLEGDGKAYLDNENLQYSISLTDKTKPHAQPQTHMTVMGQEAGLTALVDGSDLVIRDLSTIKENEEKFFGFASVMGGENRYDTGSYLRTNMWNGHAGVGWKSPRSDGSVAEYALFYDYGDGNYRTYDAGRRGHGKINYKGAGVFGRYRMGNRTFVEGSFRTGRLDNEARHVLYDGNGKGYDYDTNSRYSAFHVGLGRIYDRGSSNTVELYSRYFYTHINGDDYDAGGHYHLDSADSSLLRIGGRWNHRGPLVQYYAGIAYEYEFDGKAAGLADGAPIRNAAIQGSSVRFEVGAKYTKGPWVFDFGGHGYAGKHKGLGGNLDIAYRFF